MNMQALTTAIISAAFLAAVVSAAVSAVVTAVIARKKFLEEERARVRTIYADAFEAVAAYKELPYAIRRRRHDEPQAERIRLSEEARRIQQRLSYYRAWTQAESSDVGTAYASLVTQVRIHAGGACRQAWNDQPATTDADMNIGPDKVNLAPITPFEDAYIRATTSDVARRRTWKAVLPRRRTRPEITRDQTQSAGTGLRPTPT